MRLPFLFMPMVTFCAPVQPDKLPEGPQVAITLHCPLRFEDGITEDVELRVAGAQDHPMLRLSAPEHGIQLAGQATTTQAEADSRLEFRLQQGDVFTDGVLHETSKYVRIGRGERILARSAGPCMSD